MTEFDDCSISGKSYKFHHVCEESRYKARLYGQAQNLYIVHGSQADQSISKIIINISDRQNWFGAGQR